MNKAKEIAEHLYEYFAATGMLNASCGSSAYVTVGLLLHLVRILFPRGVVK